MNIWVCNNFLKEEPALLKPVDTNKVANLAVCCEKWIWKQFSEAQENNLAVSSKHQVVTLNHFLGGCFEQWEPQEMCAAPAQPGERLQPFQRSGHLLRQSLNSTQVRLRQPDSLANCGLLFSSQVLQPSSRAMTGWSFIFLLQTRRIKTH